LGGERKSRVAVAFSLPLFFLLKDTLKEQSGHLVGKHSPGARSRQKEGVGVPEGGAGQIEDSLTTQSRIVFGEGIMLCQREKTLNEGEGIRVRVRVRVSPVVCLGHLFGTAFFSFVTFLMEGVN